MSDTTKRLHFHFSLSCIGEGNSNPLQCSCLENPRDGGAWSAAVYGVTQSRTRLKWLSSSSSSSKMLNLGLPRDQAILILGATPKRNETHIHIETCVQMFIVSLLIVAKQWRWLKCPSVGEWTDKMEYVHVTEYYSAIKMIWILIHTAKWLNLEKMLNEKKTDTNATYCVILLNEVPRKGRFVETESKIVVAEGCGVRGIGSDY